MTSIGKGVPTLDCVATDGCKVSVQQYTPTSSHGGMIPVTPDRGPDGWVKHSDYAALESLLLDARAECDRFRHKAGQYDSIVKEVKPADGGQFRNDTIESIRILKERAERAEALAAGLEKDARRYKWLRDANLAAHPEMEQAILYGSDHLDAAIDARAAGSGET